MFLLSCRPDARRELRPAFLEPAMKIKHRRTAMPGGTRPEPVRSSLSPESRDVARIQLQGKAQKPKYRLPPVEKFIPYKS